MTDAVPGETPRRGGSSHRGAPRHPRRARPLVLGVVVLSLVVAAAALFVFLNRDDGPSADSDECGANRVTLSADPRIASVVDQATTDLSPWLTRDDCFALDVVSQASATTAAEIARPEGVGLSAPLPDLWLPDSSVWLQRAGATDVGAERIGDDSVSVATSPVVLAMLRAESEDWPASQPSWSSLLAEAEGTRTLATTDIDTDAVGLLSLWALSGSSPRRLLGVTSRLAVPLIGDEPAAQLVASGEVDAIPSSEQDVIAVNRTAADPEQVVAAYDSQVRSSLDFPLTTLAQVAPLADDDADRGTVVGRAAEIVEAALLDPATQDLMAAAGLRTPGGVLAGPYGERQGVVPDVEPGDRLPTAETMQALSSAWATVGRRSRLLVLVDRSGSMADSLPDSSDTRAVLAQRSLREAIGSIAPDSDVGLWSFTTDLPDGDWEVLVPTGPLAGSVGTGSGTRRDALLDAVDGLDPKPDGGTPLYDAVQAGYRSAQRDFAYGRLNALIVITDGRNEDPGSISLEQLVDDLRLTFDGVKPVRIIAIGYGRGADTDTLRRITDITGGRTYQALTADEVENAFAQVLSDL